jgi:hypothetical protein
VARKKKKKAGASVGSKLPGWSSIEEGTRRGIARTSLFVVATVAVAAGASYGVTRLDSHTEELILSEVDQPTFTFVDLPRSLVALAGADLEASLDGVRDHKWTSDHMCQTVADALGDVGWIAKIDSVRRLPAGRFEIRATYRVPEALVQLEEYFLLVDRAGVRLPGRYAYDPMWPIVQGVAANPPTPGSVWDGDDLRAGLAVIHELSNEPFANQITGVLVDNFGGRGNPRASHIEVATDRAGGRIRWGSAPGFEQEENLVAHKLAILRRNFQRTGRLDAGYPVIDISTFPDRFTIPG